MAKVERENDPYETLTPATERLWSLVRERGMNRRHFLQLLSAGGATAVLAACGLGSSNGGALSPEGTPTDPTAASEAGTAWVKGHRTIYSAHGRKEPRSSPIRDARVYHTH